MVKLVGQRGSRIGSGKIGINMRLSRRKCPGMGWKIGMYLISTRYVEKNKSHVTSNLHCIKWSLTTLINQSIEVAMPQ